MYTDTLAKPLWLILTIQGSFLCILKLVQITIIATICISFSEILSLPSTTGQSLKFMFACEFCHSYGTDLFIYSTSQKALELNATVIVQIFK